MRQMAATAATPITHIYSNNNFNRHLLCVTIPTRATATGEKKIGIKQIYRSFCSDANADN